MINLRDLIYGTQETTVTQENEEEEAQLAPVRVLESMRKSKPMVRYPKPQLFKTNAQKNKIIPNGYLDGPELRTENKDIPHFLPEHPSYFRFPQEEKKVPTVRRETLRNLWDQACYGGDFDSAIKILIVMTDKSSVEFSDFIKFLTLLREQRDITPSQLQTLAKTAIQSKLPPSTKKDTVKALLQMFIQLFVAEGEITEAFELLTQYISHPVMAQDPSFSGALAVLSCLEVIRFVHQSKPSLLRGITEHSDRGRTGNRGKKGTISASDSSEEISDSDSDSDDSDHRHTPRDDFPDLTPTAVASALLCPSCHDIVLNPFQFFSSVELLQQFSNIRTSSYINGRTGPDMRRMLLRCCNNLLSATENMINSQCFDLYALCCSMLEATGKSDQAHAVMKKLLRNYPKNDQVRRLYVQYLSMFRPSQRRTVLIKSLKVWLGRGNSILGMISNAPSNFPPDVGMSTTGGENSSDENEDDPGSVSEPLVNICRPGVHDRQIDEVQCALIMNQLGCLSRQDLLLVICDAIEARPPRRKVISRRPKHPDANVVKEHDSGYTEVHLALWRNLASLLGPLPSYRDLNDVLMANSSSEVVHSASNILPRALQSGVFCDSTNSSSRRRHDGCVPVDLPSDHFSAIPMKSLHSKNFTYIKLNKIDGNIDDPLLLRHLKYLDDNGDIVSLPDPTLENDVNSVMGSALEGDEERHMLVEHFRRSQQHWCTGGHIFPTHCLGDRYSQTVLESTAKRVIHDAIKLFEGAQDSTNIAGDHHDTFINAYIKAFKLKHGGEAENNGVKEDRKINISENEDFWEDLQDLCANFPQRFKNDANPVSESTSRTLSDFSVEKIEGCISKTSPLWLDIDKKKQIFRTGPTQDKAKHIYYRLGDKLLELFSHMALVKAHLSGDEDGLFIAKFSQVLIEQSERDIINSKADLTNNPAACGEISRNPTASQRCIAYLERMNLNVLREIRVANVLVANEVNPQVAPIVTCSLPKSEELLLSSATLSGKKRISRTYKPV